MFSDVEYDVEHHQLDPGDTLVLYTDGVTETQNSADDDYGCERVEEILRRCFQHDPRALVDSCLEDLAAFRGDNHATDDLTLMAIRRNPPATV
jgi:sigma-B regulation protein RsbU (phosphoserine phosphatase)